MRPPVLDLEKFAEEEAVLVAKQRSIDAERRSHTFFGKTLKVMSSVRSLVGGGLTRRSSRVSGGGSGGGGSSVGPRSVSTGTPVPLLCFPLPPCPCAIPPSAP
jgi:hypothetical protein